MMVIIMWSWSKWFDYMDFVIHIARHMRVYCGRARECMYLHSKVLYVVAIGIYYRFCKDYGLSVSIPISHPPLTTNNFLIKFINDKEFNGIHFYPENGKRKQKKNNLVRSITAMIRRQKKLNRNINIAIKK